MAKAVKGRGTKLGYGDTAIAVPTALAKVLAVKPPSITVDDIDVTDMESADEFKEFDPGWKSADTITATLQFEKAKTTVVYGLVGVSKFWTVTFSDDSKWQAQGYINNMGHASERDGVVQMEITIKVSGKPTYTPAA